MSEEKALALHLADELDAVPENGADPDLIQKSAAELRRLHAALDKAATIAHCGDLFGISEADALVEVRRITLPYWSKELAAIAKVEGV